MTKYLAYRVVEVMYITEIEADSAEQAANEAANMPLAKYKEYKSEITGQYTYEKFQN